MKAIFSPGPSYSDPETRKYAGWGRILDLYREGLEELGYDVFIPKVDCKLIDPTCTVSKMCSYDLVASRQLPLEADIFLGPAGYSIAQMTRLHQPWNKKFLYVWNNADWYRDQQLIEEYKRFGQPYDLSPAWRWINTTALEMCDHVIACSTFVKGTYSKLVPAEKISITFWGVDSQRFHPPEVEPPGFRILFAGGDPIRKGLIYLLEALKGLEGYELWIVGCNIQGGPSSWKQFGMVPNDQMPEIMRQCHVTCVPTLEDGIALVIQEGMACKLIPITSPETSEVFEDKVSGFKVGYRDVEGIREKILLLRDNPDVRKRMAEYARKRAEKDTWEKTKEEFK